jgi:glutamine synthetase
MLAAILGAALGGIEDGIEPPPPVVGNAYARDDLPRVPETWADAIARFEGSAEVARILPAELVRNYVLTKRQEHHYMSQLSPEERVELYLDTV